MRAARGKAYVIAAFVLAGSSVVAARFIADFLPPFTITFLSLAFAAATVIPLHGRQTFAALGRIGRRRRRMLFLQALFGIALFRIFLTFGLQRISAAEAGVVTGAAPALTALFAFALLRDALTAGKVAGIVLTMAGMLAVQGFPFTAAAFTPDSVAGCALVLAATACEALFAVLSRRMHAEDAAGEEPLHPVSHAGIVSVFALVLCFFPMLAESPLENIPAVPPAGWLALAWYGAVVTILAFTFLFSGARLCDGYTISALTGVIPASSLILSIIFLGADVLPHQWLGCGLIGIAIWLISRAA